MRTTFLWPVALLLAVVCPPLAGAGPSTAPRPTTRQLAHQQAEIHGLVHFGLNTFTAREAGDGTEDPRKFSPTAVNAPQWVQALDLVRAKALILVVKHHDGFCLWPSKQTDYSVRRSGWRGGQGDVVREVARACKEGYMGLGICYALWDRHEKTHGTPAYDAFVREQLRELLTGYGPLAGIWLDDRCDDAVKPRYDVAGYVKLIRQLQPQALIGGAGPDLRWLDAAANEATSSVFTVPAGSALAELGLPVLWRPAELRVAVRGAWFWHARAGVAGRSAGHGLLRLQDAYRQSVARNASLVVGVGPDPTGNIDKTDLANLREFGGQVQRRSPLAQTSGRGRELLLQLERAEPLTSIVLMEQVAEGERVRAFEVEGLAGSEWKRLGSGKVMGCQRILPVGVREAFTQVRLRVTDADGEPAIGRLAVYGQVEKPAPQ